jgi:hypothetical protein
MKLNLKSLLATAAFVAAFAGAAHAGPIAQAVVSLDPLGVLHSETGSNSQQICPSGVPRISNNFLSPGFGGIGVLGASGQFFSIVMDSAGSLSAGIDIDVIPPLSGTVVFLNYYLTDGATGLNILSQGTLAADMLDVNLTAGTYRMYVEYSYNGGADNTSATWFMGLTTGPVSQVPEPGILLLMGTALIAGALSRRRS